MLTDLRKVQLQKLYEEPDWTDRLGNIEGLAGYADYTSYLTTASDAGFSSDTSASLSNQSMTSLSASDLTATSGAASSSALAASTTLAPITDSSTSAASTSGNPFTSILTALGMGAAAAAGAVAQGAITTAALSATNAQRLAQGLPPLTAAGQVMTAAQMAAAGYSTAQIAAVQSQLGIDPETLMIVAAVGIGAFLLLSGKRS
jgi:uncharacterized protein YkwD